MTAPARMKEWQSVFANGALLKIAAVCKLLPDKIKYRTYRVKGNFLFMKEKIFTIPNMMSVFRILLIPFILWMFFTERYYIAAGLLVLSGITDLLDGFIARRFHMISALGKALDPIADKLTILAVLYCSSGTYHGHHGTFYNKKDRYDVQLALARKSLYAVFVFDNAFQYYMERYAPRSVFDFADRYLCDSAYLSDFIFCEQYKNFTASKHK